MKSSCAPGSLPSTSTSGAGVSLSPTLMDLSDSSESKNSSPLLHGHDPVPKIKLQKIKNRNSEDSSTRTESKKLKHLFGSDEEEEKRSGGSSPVDLSQPAESLTRQYSPISSEDDDDQEALGESCQPQAMDLSTSPKELVSVAEISRSQNVNDNIIKELTEKIKRAKALVQSSVGAEDCSQPMVKIFKSEINIKKEPGLVPSVPTPAFAGYSEEPECITILDSDEEQENDFAAGLVGSTEEQTEEETNPFDGGDFCQEPLEDEDSDDEVQIISASETPLFAAIAKKIKVEYDSEDQEASEDNPEDTIDEACATIEKSLEKLQEDELVRDVMHEVGCRRVNVMEAIEQAKLSFNSSSPTYQQIVQVLSGEYRDSDSDEEVPRRRKKKKISPSKQQNLNSSSDSITDLLKDSGEESYDENQSQEKQTERSSAPTKSSDQNEPSTSTGSSKNTNLIKFDKSYKVPKKSPLQKPVAKSISSGEKFLPVSLRRSSEEAKALRKLKLAEIAKKKVNLEVEARESNVPAGIMRNSNSKGHKLLQDLNLFQPSQPKPRKAAQKCLKTSGLRKKQQSTKEREKNLTIPAGNLGTSSTRGGTSVEDNIFKETEDGYRVPRKLSVSNIQYNDADRKEPLKKKQKPIVSIIKTKARHIKGNVRWRDDDGFHPLVSAKFIPSENEGKRVTRKNNKDDSLKIKKIPQNVNVDNDDKITTDDILRKILSWNPLWLEEQKKHGSNEPPPVHQPWQLIPVTSTFSSWQEYRRIFLPLMLQELWSVISKDYEERKCQRGAIMPVSLQRIYQDHPGQFNTARCLAVISEQQVRREFLTEGTLVKLDVSYDFITSDGKKGRKIQPSFAFIYSQQRTRRDDKSLGEADRESIRMLQTKTKAVGDHVVFLTLRLKQHLAMPGGSQLANRPVTLHCLARIRPELRKFTALLELPQCRLFASIISPSQQLVQVRSAGSNLHAFAQGLHSLSNLNQLQREIIVQVSQACVLDRDVPRISLVQGPPGTGKSSTIAGLILQILFTSMVNLNPKTMARVLVVAPSNAAVDQLTLKLLALQSELPPQQQFQMLRLGVSHSINPLVKSVSYDELLDSHREAQTRHSKASDSVERDVRSKQKAAEQILAEQVRAEQDGRTDLAAKLRRDYREKLAQINRLTHETKKPLNAKSRRDIERIAVERTLSGADVILTTLSSSKFRPLEKYLVEGAGTSKAVGAMKPVSVCIIDEASQCVEPEALMPLKYGFSKLVMVGDHEQLPATVTSRRAQELDYQQSLFSRLISSMESQPGPSPILRLNTQYRMDPEIADWPARYFYGGKLSHGAPDRETGLRPYQVINVVGEMRQAGGSSFNKTEEKVALAAVDAVRELNRELDIGVITYYAKQKENIAQELMKRKLGSVVVNTVDGYQGSERDVIIISCVRSGAGIGFLQDRQRLNVALTRAKHCLVLIGDMQNLRYSLRRFIHLQLFTNRFKSS